MYESAALRRFVGVDLGVAAAPDETTVCRFRHLLEKHDLGGLMLEAVNVLQQMAEAADGRLVRRRSHAQVYTHEPPQRGR